MAQKLLSTGKYSQIGRHIPSHITEHGNSVLPHVNTVNCGARFSVVSKGKTCNRKVRLQ